jgi:hypothetical protein
MSPRVEFWALVVMLVVGFVILIGEVIDQDWVRTVLWALTVSWTGAALLRRRSKRPSE